MIPYGRQHIDDADIESVVNCLKSGFITQGAKISEFETAVANYVGARFAVAVSSGTAALHLAAIVLDLGPKDVWLTSPNTFVASANAALYVGAKPGFVDIEGETANMCPHALSEAVKEDANVKVIVPVHYAGLPCDMPKIKAIADKAGAVIVEDAAHALGAKYPNGKTVGCCEHSLLTIFSFHPVKSITTGEGGMITTNDEKIYKRLLRLRSHGITKGDDPFCYPENAKTDGDLNTWYCEMQELGYHYRITDIQCALGFSQLLKLDKFVAWRRKLALRYDDAFAGLTFLRPAQSFGRDFSAHHLYPVRIDFTSLKMTRAALMKNLREGGLICQVHYLPVPLHPLYRKLGFSGEHYPNAYKYYQETLSLPLFYDLREEQQEEVVAVFKEILSCCHEIKT